jgi:hypothetical protein
VHRVRSQRHARVAVAVILSTLSLLTCVLSLLTCVAAFASHSSNEHWKKFGHDGSEAHFKILWSMQAGEWSVPDSANDWSSGQGKLEVKQERDGDCDHNCTLMAQAAPPFLGMGEDCTGALGVTDPDSGSDDHLDFAATYLNRSCVNSANSYKRHTITCHEIGHLVKLFHRNGGNSSCLEYPYSDVNANHPDSHDKDAIVGMYSHGS